MMIDDILTLAAVVLSMVFFFFYRRYNFSIYNEIDRRYYTQDDYTLYLKNIPVFIETNIDEKSNETIFWYEKAIRNMLEGRLNAWFETLRAT